MNEDFIGEQKKKRSHEETDVQGAIIQWFRLTYPHWSRLLIPMLNGMKMTASQARVAKKLGLQKGIPDLLLAKPVVTSQEFKLPDQNIQQHMIWCGLFVEVKTEKGKPTKEQLEFLDIAAQVGYRSSIVYGFDDAAKTIDEYLAGTLR